MRKLILILLLLPFVAIAQYPAPLPTSGALSISTIKQWMYAAGEITLTERDGAYSIAYLNTKSHLVDKTAPYSINDWYGYTQNNPSLLVWKTSDSFFNCLSPGQTADTNVYSSTGTFTAGSVLYSNSARTTVLTGYKFIFYQGANQYATINTTTGVLGTIQTCN